MSSSDHKLLKIPLRIFCILFLMYWLPMTYQSFVTSELSFRGIKVIQVQEPNLYWFWFSAQCVVSLVFVYLIIKPPVNENWANE